MENLGINIFESDIFCSDIAALFFKHMWECKDCLVNVLGYFLAFICAILFFFVLSQFISSLILEFIDTCVYARKFKSLSSEHHKFKVAYDNLLYQYNELGIKYAELEKEYYYTCN